MGIEHTTSRIYNQTLYRWPQIFDYCIQSRYSKAQVISASRIIEKCNNVAIPSILIISYEIAFSENIQALRRMLFQLRRLLWKRFKGKCERGVQLNVNLIIHFIHICIYIDIGILF